MTRYYFGSLPPGSPKILDAYDRLFSDPPKYVAIDTETYSLSERYLLGIGFATPDDHAFYFTWPDPRLPWHLYMKDMASTRKIYQNAPFDLAWEVLGQFHADIDNIEETTILTRMLHLPVPLELISNYVPHTTHSISTYLREYDVKAVSDLPEEAIARKCCLDCLVTMDVWKQFSTQVDWDTYLTERRFMSLLLHMSHRGIKLDQDKVKAIDAELENDLTLYFGQARALGFNPNSSDEVSTMLSTHQGGNHIFSFRRGAMKPTVTDNVLSMSNHPWAALTRVARKTNKMHSRIHKWLGHERLRSHFRTDSSTWRVKSSGQHQAGQDNTQNLDSGRSVNDIHPKAGALRSVLIPDINTDDWFHISGIPDDFPVFTKFDFMQIELRMFAFLAEDEELQWYLNYGRDNPNEPREKWPDFHRDTQQLFKLTDRRPAKAFNFGMLYGGADEVLAAATGIRDLEKIREFKLGWNNRWPKSAAYMERARQETLRTMRVQTLFGRTLYIEDTNKELTEKHIGNTGIAFPSQGSAAEVFKRGLLMLVDAGFDPDIFVNNVHDDTWLNGRFTIPEEALSSISQVWTPVEVEYLTYGK